MDKAKRTSAQPAYVAAHQSPSTRRGCLTHVIPGYHRGGGTSLTSSCMRPGRGTNGIKPLSSTAGFAQLDKSAFKKQSHPRLPSSSRRASTKRHILASPSAAACTASASASSRRSSCCLSPGVSRADEDDARWRGHPHTRCSPTLRRRRRGLTARRQQVWVALHLGEDDRTLRRGRSSRSYLNGPVLGDFNDADGRGLSSCRECPSLWDVLAPGR